MSKFNLREHLKGIEGVATALNAMCDGLVYQDSRQDFRVNMDSFGCVKFDRLDNPICIGCAATCASQELAGIDLDSESIDYRFKRTAKMKLASEDALYDFECAVNEARYGDLHQLFKFCGLWAQYSLLLRGNWHLLTDNWKPQIHKVRKYIKTLMKDNDLEWGFVAEG